MGQNNYLEIVRTSKKGKFNVAIAGYVFPNVIWSKCSEGRGTFVQPFKVWDDKSKSFHTNVEFSKEFQLCVKRGLSQMFKEDKKAIILPMEELNREYSVEKKENPLIKAEAEVSIIGANQKRPLVKIKGYKLIEDRHNKGSLRVLEPTLNHHAPRTAFSRKEDTVVKKLFAAKDSSPRSTANAIIRKYNKEIGRGQSKSDKEL